MDQISQGLQRVNVALFSVMVLPDLVHVNRGIFAKYSFPEKVI
jgi:hypothetical protein